MNNDIFEKLKAIAVNDIGIDADKVKPESDIIKELGLDSLDIVDMLMKVEETFGVTIDDSDVVEMKTVADVVRFIENAARFFVRVGFGAGSGLYYFGSGIARDFLPHLPLC